MKKEIEICGFKFDESQMVKSLDEKFDTFFDDEDNAFFISKAEYEHDEEGFKFKYRYCIEVNWVDENEYLYSLMLVPTCESVNKEKQESVLSSGGCDEIYDVCSYGCNVSMCSACEKSETWDEGIVTKMMSIVEVINSLRGFYLDRYVNRIGNTGWDMLDDFINGNDFLKKVI